MSEGIDVSYAQGSVEWGEVAKAKAFAFCKVSEGTTVADNTWSKARVDALRKAKLPFGVYHFARPSSGKDGRDEAEFFFKHAIAAGWGKHGDLVGALDLETASTGSYLAVAAYVRGWVRTYKRLAKQHGFKRRKPIIYTGSFWRDFLRNPVHLTRCRLWLAAYVSNPGPYVPRSFKRISIWQFGIGTCRGVAGQVDLDRAYVPVHKLTI